MAAITMERVSKHFGTKSVLKDLSLEVQPGTIYALVGRQGTGKTTALKILAGKLRPEVGRISVTGVACLPEPKLGAMLRASNPFCRDIILLDEPCAGMSGRDRWRYLHEVKALAQLTGAAVIIASRDLAELSMIADAGGILEDGKIVQRLSKWELRACGVQSLWGALDAEPMPIAA
jgi:ABC-type multidrug transport system ATPase subunit